MTVAIRGANVARATLCVMMCVGLSSTATAKRSKKPEDVFKGDIVLSKKRFPRKFDSDKAMIKHMKKVDTKVFYANDKGDWKFRYMIFSKKPVGTMTAEMTYYDITDGEADAVKVNTFSIYPSSEKDRVISGTAKLTQDGDFKGHRKYRMIFSRGYGRKALASTDFILYPSKDAEPEKASNTVNF